MWNAFKRFVQRMDKEGRDKFVRLASDQERAAAIATNAAMVGSLLASVLAGVYFALYVALILVYGRPAEIPLIAWIYLVYVCMMLGSIQGGASGALLGWAQGLLWQGKRRKAGTVCVAGGVLVAAAMALFESRYYTPDLPPPAFLFWALVLFSPGYLAASGVAAWGMSLLAGKKSD